MATVSQITADPAFESSFFWDHYKGVIIAIGAVLLLGLLGFGGYQVYRARQANEATALLANADSPAQYQAVIDRFPGTEPAASAYLLLAAQLRLKQKYADASTTLQKFIAKYPKHELITTAWMGVAANLESLGKQDEALSTYQRLATEYPKSFNAPLALLAQIPFLKAKNRTDEARRVCETVLTQYRDSIVASEAMRELSSLPATASTAPIPQPTAAPIPMARPPEELAAPSAKP